MRNLGFDMFVKDSLYTEVDNLSLNYNNPLSQTLHTGVYAFQHSSMLMEKQLQYFIDPVLSV
jgi:hypothetical protein